MCGTVRAEAATTAEQDDGAGAAAAAVPSDSADGQGTKRRSEEAGLDATPSEHRTLGTDHTSQKIKSVRRELDTVRDTSPHAIHLLLRVETPALWHISSIFAL